MGRALVRPLTHDDLPRLGEINPTFTSDAVLHVEKAEAGLGVTWRLVEVPLATPFDKGHGYDLQEEDFAAICKRLAEGTHLLRVAECGGRLVALLDVEGQAWNRTAIIWSLDVDLAHRRRGLGRRLMEEAIAWARAQGYRALTLETQNNNIHACRFYRRMGLRLTGIRDDFYSNDDLSKGEVAIFWSYVLDPQ